MATTPGTYSNITDPGKVNRMGGTKQYILLCPLADFLLLKKAAAGTYVINEAHTFQPTKGFIKLYVTKDTGEVNLDTQGGPDRNSFAADGTFYHPGESEEINAFANLAKNDRFVVLVPLPGVDHFVQLGDADFQVQVKPKWNSTKNSGDGRGWTFEMSTFQADMILYKAATVTLLP